MASALALAAALACVLALGAAVPCRVTFSGVTYDLTPLIATNGSYTWTEKAYSVADNNIYAGSPDDAATYTFELQVCAPVVSANPGCKPGSAINRIDSQGKCLSLGNATVAQFSPNPFNDGVYLAYYGSDDVNHIQKYSARIYFVCDQAHAVTPPVFEHEKSFYQSHFSINTKLACSP